MSESDGFDNVFPEGEWNAGREPEILPPDPRRPRPFPADQPKQFAPIYPAAYQQPEAQPPKKHRAVRAIGVIAAAGLAIGFISKEISDSSQSDGGTPRGTGATPHASSSQAVAAAPAPGIGESTLPTVSSSPEVPALSTTPSSSPTDIPSHNSIIKVIPGKASPTSVNPVPPGVITMPKPSPTPRPVPPKTKHVAPPPKPRPNNEKLYILGDSYAALALENGLAQAVHQSGGQQLTVNAVVGRALDQRGQGDETGLEALKDDSDAIQQADAVVIEEGTNGGTTAENLSKAIHLVRDANSQAPIYVMNLGALGYGSQREQKHGHKHHDQQQGYIDALNAENDTISHLSNPLDFQILNWCGVVFGGNADDCHVSSDNLRSKYLGPDNVHPSLKYGVPAFNDLIASTVPRQN